MTLAEKIKNLRSERDWTQAELAKRAGLTRGYIANLEGTRPVKRPSAVALLKLANAFNVRPEEFYQAAGYIKEVKPIRPRAENPEEILSRLELTFPISIPIYEDFPFQTGELAEPIDYVYRTRPRAMGKNMAGYLIHDKYLEIPTPDGEVIIIIDRDGEIKSGDIVACLIDSQLRIARLKKIEGELWLENNTGRIKLQDCKVVAPVIEIRRRLK